MPHEGPLDLRLVPAAVAAWASASVGLALSADQAWLLTAAAALVAAATILLAGRAGSGAGPAVLALWAAAAVLASCAGHLAGREAGPLRAAAADRSVVVLTGVLVGEPVPERVPWLAGQVRGVLRLDTVSVHGSPARATGEVLVVGEPATLALPVGAEVRLSGRLSPTTGRREAVLAVAEGVVQGPGSWLDRTVGALHERLREAVAPLGPDARGLVPGAAVGDTAGVEPELDRAMRTAGLTHLVAVSGQHVAIVLVTALAVAGVVRAPRWLRVLLAALAVAGFAVLVGGGASVLRAVVMGGVGVLGLAVGRPSRPVPALALAVVALLVHDPWAVTELGLQLSVAATAAIVLLAGPAVRAVGARWPAWRHGVRAVLLVATAVPLAAQSAVAPLLVLVDPTVTPWAVPANVLAALAVVPLTLLALAATLAPFGAVAQALAWLAAIPAGWVAGVARAAAAMPGAALPWRPGPAGAVGLTALLAAAWLAGHLLLGRRDA